jgi:hypothetical protein
MNADAYKRCSTCKAPIAFGAAYFACSVSTCNRKATDFAFCSIGCWDAHVPVYRHRDAWAEDRRAPTREAHAAAVRAEAEAAAQRERRAAERTEPTPIVPSGPLPHDVLVVVSKVKAYVRARSGMKTSDTVMPLLSDRLRSLCDAAIERASQAGRKTVLDRDFED